MKSHRAVGLIFMIILASLSSLFILEISTGDLEFLHPFGSRSKTVTFSNDQTPANVYLHVKAGIVKITKNSTVSGWLANITYDERDTPPSLSFENGSLIIDLNNGIVHLSVNDLSKLTFDFGSIDADIVFYNSTLSINGNVGSGNLNLNIYNCNVSINSTIKVGNIDIQAYNSSITGHVDVNIGNIDLQLSTPLGGDIAFQVNMGSADITAEGFRTEKKSVDSGVVGRVYRDGFGINLLLTVNTGQINIVAIGL